nr:MAG TPA: hypothetical protein [Bacteriophage sp.]
MLYKNVKTGATIETICNLGGDWVLDEGDDYIEEDVLLEDEADEVEEEPVIEEKKPVKTASKKSKKNLKANKKKK